jgi:phosphatidylserine decarboxylase
MKVIKAMKSNLFLFSRSSLPYIAGSFAVFLIFSILDLELLAILSIAFMFFAAYTFRNPQREYRTFETNSVVSPVDGTVINVEEIEDDSYAYKIVIESSYTDISILRAPLDAKVVSLSVQRGTRVSSKSKLFYDLNENALLTIADKDGHEIQISHRLTQSFAPLMFDIANNDELVKLSPYGVMLCGITEIYLPKGFKSSVASGAKVFASETLLGHF